jgi:PIN domain nuclease of toxin-antitoxin system
MRILLDTHVLLWWFGEKQRLSRDTRRALENPGANKLHLSGISFWEIATLFELGRIQLDRPLLDWLEEAEKTTGLRLEPITARVAAAVAELPPTFHRDPADRIIVATAKVVGATLATMDRRIQESKLIPVIA